MGPIRLTHNNNPDMPSATACKNHRRPASHGMWIRRPFIDGTCKQAARAAGVRERNPPCIDGVCRTPAVAQRDHGPEQGRCARAEPLDTCLQTASSPQ